MKNNFKRITASIAATALCAVSTMVTSVNAANYPRYTYRTVFTRQAQPVLNNQPTSIKNVVINYSVRKNRPYAQYNVINTNSKSLYSLVPGTTGNSAGDKYFTCGGTFQAKYANDTKRGIVCTISSITSSTVSPDPSFTVISKNKNGIEVDRNTQNVDYYGLSINEVNYKWSAIAVDTILVGDLNGDNEVDGKDYNIFMYAKSLAQSRQIYDTIWVRIDQNTTALLPVYKFDINNDGMINDNDYKQFDRYLSGMLPYFYN